MIREEAVAEYPQKDSYRLKEVCRVTDTQPYVLRHWESEFPQLKGSLASGGRRIYSRADIDLIQRIKELLEECTLAEARKELERETSGKKPRRSTAAARAAGAAPRIEPQPAKPEKEVAAQRIAAALPPREIPEPAPAGDLNTVERGRYEDAIEEIDHLRLQLKESERSRRKADSALEEANLTIEIQRQRAERATARLEKLLESLD
jgi:DNA-binding transcriptional MerR regulator